MTKLLIILLTGLVFEAVGVVYLNKGLRQVGEVQQISVAEVLRVIKSGVDQPQHPARSSVRGDFFLARCLY